MNETETIIMLNLENLSKYIPQHLDKWRNITETVFTKVQGISNLADQLRAVTETKLEYMDNFKQSQESLRYSILTCIEEDLKSVRESIDKLSRINAQFRDKMEKLEISSHQLDWDDDDSILLQGTPTIPPLGRLLSLVLDFYIYFQNIYKTIQARTKALDYMNENNVRSWEAAFVVPFKDVHCVNYLLALTQYVDSEVV